MTNRKHLLLGVLLLVQLALILLLRSPFGAASARTEARPLLPALDTAKPAKIEVSGSGSEHVTLVRNGDAWSLSELGGFPADTKKIHDLIENLKGLRVRRPVVTSNRYHEQFKVADKTHEGRVRLWSEGQGQPAVDLWLGSSPDYRTLNVRVDGADPVYEVRGLASYDVRADAGAWIAKEVVDAKEADVTELQLTNAKGSFEIKKQDGKWVVAAPDKLKGRGLNSDKVGALVRSVTALRLSNGAGKLDAAAQGFAPPAATLLVKWGGASTPETATEPDQAGPAVPPGERTIRIGAKSKDKDSERYLTWSGFDYAGTVWDSSVTSLVDQGLDALLAS